jgi:hypothetical protein
MKINREQCPVCLRNWIPDPHPAKQGDYYDEYYVCPNSDCRFGIIITKNGKWIYLYKCLGEIEEVWWVEKDNTYDRCEIRIGRRGFSIINFVPPVNITLERLKTLVLFS